MVESNYLINHPDFTSEYTFVYSESPEDMKYDAPHHFLVRNMASGEIVGKVDFQEGPIKEVGVNGVCNEDLILMLVSRLEAFQKGKYACNENEEAIIHLMQAINVLRSRTNRRKAAGIEGTSALDTEVNDSMEE